MSIDLNEVICMIDGREIFFSIKKDGWHWCVYKHTKVPGGTAATKEFNEWYFTKYYAERRAVSLIKHYHKLNEKMKFEERYLSHLEVILEKEDE